ncbi:MAG: hypothetical protein ACRDOF_07170 [Gaiellaceae bacterium]
MRLRLSTALLAIVSAFAVAGCGGGSGGTPVAGEPISFEELTQSASSSAEATSGRFAFEMTTSFPGAPEQFAFSGEGAFDAASKRASFSVDMSSLASLLGGLFAGLGGAAGADAPDFDDPSGWKIDAVQDGTVSYVRFPALQSELPAGKSWIRTDGGDLAVQGFDFSELDQFTKTDPRELLGVLGNATGEIETVGTEELRGVETTHYRTVLDSSDLGTYTLDDEGDKSSSLAEQLAAQPGLGEVPVDFWLDANGLVRKLTMAFSAMQPGTSEASEVSMTFELWDYGEAVEIDLPSASEVVDASAVR